MEVVEGQEEHTFEPNLWINSLSDQLGHAIYSPLFSTCNTLQAALFRM
uniref:Uncharacterized protein n=1 Tax=Moniliophthora roreri TaxID=221103 RepID=A0A0W0G4N4_MONRR